MNDPLVKISWPAGELKVHATDKRAKQIAVEWMQQPELKFFTVEAVKPQFPTEPEK